MSKKKTKKSMHRNHKAKLHDVKQTKAGHVKVKHKGRSRKILYAMIIALVILSAIIGLAIRRFSEKPVFEAGSIDDPDANKPDETKARMLAGSGDIGVVLVHGIAATAWETKLLAEYLFEKGITTRQVLMSGHGNSIYELEKSYACDWYKSVQDALDEMNHPKKFIIGVSVGCLAAVEASINNDVNGIVLISVPIKFYDKRMGQTPFLKYFKRFSHRELPSEHKQYYHENFPLSILAEMMNYIGRIKEIIAEVTTPVLIVQSRNDPRIKPESAQYVYDNIGSKDKALLWLNMEEHVPIITYAQEPQSLTQEREMVFWDIYEFIIQNSRFQQSSSLK